MKKLINILLSRVFIVGFLIFLQAAILAVAIWRLSNNYVYVYAANSLLSIIIVVWLISKNDNPSVKLPWIIVILLLPIFGGLFYICFGSSNVSFNIKKRLNSLVNETNRFYPENKKILQEVEAKDKHIAGQMKYIQNITSAPVYGNNYTKYFPIGEDIFECLIEELKKAKRFIFMEYFIVEEGKLWNEILDILASKVKEGVEVRFMYDDVGCVNTLPKKYHQKLESLGIKCTVFNPFRPTLSVSLQNRDHRKITVIDGLVGFTGGVNLADEYINVFEKHGHWKDAGLILKGESVWSLTMLFLQSWNFYRPTDKDYLKYKANFTNIHIDGAGYVQPYGDHPFDDELVSESVYLNLINFTTDYLYINTPYLIVDNELVTALVLAAKRGVDVRICTPHIADKWYVHVVTQAYYPILIKAGVKIFEYTPGFIHSKTFVADDKVAIVGTINMDYRSLYHHFECGVLMYDTDTVAQTKEDFEITQKICTNITWEICRQVPWFKKIIRGIVRIFAPLM